MVSDPLAFVVGLLLVVLILAWRDRVNKNNSTKEQTARLERFNCAKVCAKCAKELLLKFALLTDIRYDVCTGKDITQSVFVKVCPDFGHDRDGDPNGHTYRIDPRADVGYSMIYYYGPQYGYKDDVVRPE